MATVRGLREFLSALGDGQRKIAGKALREGNKAAADIVAQETQRQARRNNLTSRAASQVKAVGDRLEAKVAFTKTNAKPFTFGAFFGSRRYRQFRPWVGNQFQPGDAGGIHTSGMPYAAAEAIEAKGDEIDERYLDLIEDALARAFPE